MCSLCRDLSPNRGRLSPQFGTAPAPALTKVRCVNKVLTLALLLPVALCPALGQTAAAVSAAPAATGATGAIPDNLVPAETLNRGLALLRDAATAVAPRRARVVVEPGRLDPRLTLASCTRVDAYLPAGMPAWGRVRLGLRCLEGRVRWNVFLPVHVQVVAPAVVATVNLPTGAKLEESQLRVIDTDWSAEPGSPHEQAQPLVGRVLARPLQAGQPVLASHLQNRVWFASGETVRILVTGSGFAIQSEGQALTPGQEGRQARVQTDGGRVVTGLPVGERVIEVKL